MNIELLSSHCEEDEREALRPSDEELSDLYYFTEKSPRGSDRDERVSDILVEARGTGCIAILERLPLWSKLLLPTLVSLVGLLGLSAMILYLELSNVTSKQNITAFIEGARNYQRVINAIKDERQWTVIYMTYRTNESFVKQCRTDTDESFQYLVGNLEKIRNDTINLRESIDNHNITVPDMIKRYGDLIDLLQEKVSQRAKNASLSDNSMPILLVAVQLVETVNRMSDYLFGVNFKDRELVDSFKDLRTKYMQFFSLFRSIIGENFDIISFSEMQISYDNMTVSQTITNVITFTFISIDYLDFITC